jgi:hypothetical protein
MVGKGNVRQEEEEMFLTFLARKMVRFISQDREDIS